MKKSVLYFIFSFSISLLNSPKLLSVSTERWRIKQKIHIWTQNAVASLYSVTAYNIWGLWVIITFCMSWVTEANQIKLRMRQISNLQQDERHVQAWHCFDLNTHYFLLFGWVFGNTAWQPCVISSLNMWWKDIFNSGVMEHTHKPKEAFHTVKRN